MNIVGLFLKPQPGAEMVGCQSLTLKRGWGIEGDANADVGCPRQVLLLEQRVLTQFDLQPGDLWENVLVDEFAPFESGDVLQIGTALIRLTFHCEPCARLESRRVGLAKQIKRQRGVLAMVVRSGIVHLGDRLSLTADQFSPLGDDVRSRFNEFVARIPAGKWVTTADLILALGVANSYYRAIPALIKKSPADLPVHRIVSSDRSLLRHIPEHELQLVREGVEVTDGKVRSSDRWQPEHFHSLVPTWEKSHTELRTF